MLIIWTLLVLTAEPCPTSFQPMANFDMKRYKGTWRISHWYGSLSAGPEAKCGTVIYNEHPEGLTTDNMIWFGDKPDQRTFSLKGFDR